MTQLVKQTSTSLLSYSAPTKSSTLVDSSFNEESPLKLSLVILFIDSLCGEEIQSQPIPTHGKIIF